MPSDILANYGFDGWFQKNIKGDMPSGTGLARVTAVHKDSYTISNGVADVHAELVGRLAFNAHSPLDFPAVGDWVFASLYDDDTLGIIHKMLPRKTFLKRKTPGRRTDYQLIATNINTAFIVQSLETNFNLNRMERYLAMVYKGGLAPIVLLSKKDLMTEDETRRRVEQIKKVQSDLSVEAFSNQDPVDVDHIKKLFLPKQTFCLFRFFRCGQNNPLEQSFGGRAA